MKIPLTGGFYATDGLIAEAQRCVNLYPERNPEDAPFPFTHYCHPGLRSLLSAQGAPCRCLYRASTGDLYGVIGDRVCYMAPSYAPDGSLAALALTVLGTIASTAGVVSMKDNRLIVLVVDGTGAGYYIDLTNNRALGTISTPAFYGATRVDFRDTFFLLNRPGTAQWYISSSETTAGQIVGGPASAGSIAGGSGYPNGVYPAVAMIGGTGNGAIADITVTVGAVSGVHIVFGGDLYLAGDILTASGFALAGAINATTNVSNGAGYANGSYTNVALIGGSGTGAVATLFVSSNQVTLVTITTAGSAYKVGDLLTAPATSLGGTGGGFQAKVTGASGTGAGFTFTLTQVDAGANAFNSLDIAAKATDSDSLVAVIAANQQEWLIGEKTSEVWYNAGTPDFTFGRLPGVFIEHGCAAPYSICKADQSILWLSQDKDGQSIILRGEQYAAKRVSTHAIEQALAGYATVSDCVALTYQQRGHTFCQFSFPSADATWVYDLATDLWTQKTWTDANGLEHRHRANVSAFAYGANIVGDWQTGELYALDPAIYTDDGAAIVRRRGFPHLVNEGKRVEYDRFIAEIEVGSSLYTTSADRDFALLADAGNDALEAVNPLIALLAAQITGPGYASAAEPAVSLRWSDDKGRTFGNPIALPIGAMGEFATSVQARMLGMGRDRVFEMFWAGDFPVALNGAYIDVTPAET